MWKVEYQFLSKKAIPPSNIKTPSNFRDARMLPTEGKAENQETG
jgi:hypothetical protein